MTRRPRPRSTSRSGADFAAYTRVAEALAAAGLARVTSTTVALTPKGHELGAEIERTLGARRALRDAEEA